jgi:dienelactone hydrolase
MTTHLTDELRDFLYRYDESLPLEPEESVLEEGDRYTKWRVVYSSAHRQRVPATVYLPKGVDGPRPAALLQHGASTTKDDYYIQQPSRRWAERGYVTMAIDAPEHGERRADDGLPLGQELWRRGAVFRMRDMRIQAVIDLRRAVDYLTSRSEVDAGRLGYLGVSLGTFIGVPFVALEPRVRAAVFLIGGGGLRRVWTNGSNATEDEIDLVQQSVDPVHFAARIAPRPVLMMNGRQDETVPPVLSQRLYEALRDPKEIRWFDIGHTVTGEIYKQALAFFDEHLSA